jgi:hypothetical protein
MRCARIREAKFVAGILALCFDLLDDSLPASNATKETSEVRSGQVRCAACMHTDSKRRGGSSLRLPFLDVYVHIVFKVYLEQSMGASSCLLLLVLAQLLACMISPLWLRRHCKRWRVLLPRPGVKPSNHIGEIRHPVIGMVRARCSLVVTAFFIREDFSTALRPVWKPAALVPGTLPVGLIRTDRWGGVVRSCPLELQRLCYTHVPA